MESKACKRGKSPGNIFREHTLRHGRRHALGLDPRVDPAIQITLKDMCFLLLDGPIKPTPVRFVFLTFVFAAIPEIAFAIAGNR